MRSPLEQNAEIRKAALGTPAGFLAFGLGSGLSRFAPGTMGTIVAIPFALVLKLLPQYWFWATLLMLFLLGIYLCEVTARRMGMHDPGGIVWDEMVGYWLTVALVPAQWPWLLAGFVLFRLFDIFKPWPIRQSERWFQGGLGIMIDDILAALYAMVVLAGIQLL